MKTIEESYCSYEVSKLLKEKGFDAHCSWFYNRKGQQRHIEMAAKKRNSMLSIDSCSMPTHQMAMAWLREEKGFFIEIHLVFDQFTDEPCYKALIWDLAEQFGKPLPDDREYMFYETCVKDALKYTLENLI